MGGIVSLLGVAGVKFCGTIDKAFLGGSVQITDYTGTLFSELGIPVAFEVSV